jgi:hypothetical protein
MSARSPIVDLRSSVNPREAPRVRISRLAVMVLVTAIVLVSASLPAGRAAVIRGGTSFSLRLATDASHKSSSAARRKRGRRLKHGARVEHARDGVVGSKLAVSVEGTVGADAYQPDTAASIRNAGVSWDRDANAKASRSLGFSNLVVAQDGSDGNCTGDSVSEVVALARSSIASMEANG